MKLATSIPVALVGPDGLRRDIAMFPRGLYVSTCRQARRQGVSFADAVLASLERNLSLRTNGGVK